MIITGFIYMYVNLRWLAATVAKLFHARKPTMVQLVTVKDMEK